MDKGRAFRTLAVTALVFLLTGTGAGFASAGQDAPGTLPWPGVGDKVTYRVTPVFLDRSLPDWDPGIVKMTLEWLPMQTLVDDAWAEHAVLPLRITHHLSDGYDVPMVAYYDAQTGAGLADGWGLGQSDSGSGLLGGRSATDELSYRLYEAMRGPCGVLTPFHGGVLEPRPVDLQGHCTYYQVYQQDEELWGGPLTTPFGPLEGDDDLLGLRSLRDEGIQIWYEPGHVFPARMVTPLTNVGGEPGRLWSFERLSEVHADAPYPRVIDSLVDAGPGPVRLTTRTPWNLDDADMGHPFPLHEAYQAALDDGASPSVSDFLASHPDAYLGQAWSNRQDDGTGNGHYYWWMTWTDGFDTLSKQVVSRPAGVQGVTLDDVRTVEVSAYRYQNIESGQRHFPAPSALPDRLPLVSDVMARYRLVEDPARLPDQPNRYGMGYYCDEAACDDPATLVAAGYFVMDLNAYGTLARTTVEGDHYAYSQVMVTETGYPMYTETAAYARDPAVLLALPTAARPAGQEAVEAGLWAPPTAGAAAGLGFLALLVGVLYYFWPALKAGPVLSLFSRIHGDAVLEHPTRRAVYEAVQGEPGIHFTALRKQLDMGRGVLEHHLKKLEDSGHVSARSSNGYRCLFPKDVADRHVRDAVPVTRAAGAQAILGIVGDEPGLAPGDVAVRAGLAASTVSYHLGRLREAGVIEGRSDLRLTDLGRTLRAKAAA